MQPCMLADGFIVGIDPQHFRARGIIEDGADKLRQDIQVRQGLEFDIYIFDKGFS